MKRDHHPHRSRVAATLPPVALALALCLVLFSGLGCPQQPAPTDTNGGTDDTPPAARVETVTFSAEDGTQLTGSHFAPKDGAEPPAAAPRAVIAIHMYPADRHSYDGLAMKLSDRGVHVLTYDLRGVGDSGTEAQHGDYESMVAALFQAGPSDVVAAKAWLVSEHGIDDDAVAIVGGSIGASITLAAVAADPSLSPVVLMSAGDDYFGWDVTGHFAAIGDRPAFISYATGKPAEQATAEAIATTLRDAGNEQVTVRPVEGGHEQAHAGFGFETDGALEGDIVAFLLGE